MKAKSSRLSGGDQEETREMVSPFFFFFTLDTKFKLCKATTHGGLLNVGGWITQRANQVHAPFFFQHKT